MQTAPDSPDHPPTSENWTPAYVIVGLVPLVFAAVATASVLLTKRRRRRRLQQQQQQNGQQGGDVELAHLRRHEHAWFPWREAVAQTEELFPPPPANETAVAAAAAAPGADGGTAAITPPRPSAPLAVAAPSRVFGTTRHGRKLGSTLAGGSRGRGAGAAAGATTGVGGSSAVSGTEGGQGQRRVGNPFAPPKPSPPKPRAVSPGPFCHGYGARRASDTRTEWIDAEGMEEVDLGHRVSPEEREKREREREREVWKERIRGLTRDDDIVLRGQHNTTKGQTPEQTPRRGLAKYLPRIGL